MRIAPEIVLILVVFVPGLMISTPQSLSSAQTPAEAIVRQLRDLPTPLPATPHSDGSIDPVEQRRHELYDQLRLLGDDALPALSNGLLDPDVRLRRNVALVLNVLAGGWFERSWYRTNIRPCLPALMKALGDNDADVRAWSAQAIGDIGPDAAEAVPALIALLRNQDVGSRNSAAIALRGIGPEAKSALPALREALSDPNKDVRRFAAAAIEKIEGH
jgi:HEAT repeat protein